MIQGNCLGKCEVVAFNDEDGDKYKRHEVYKVDSQGPSDMIGKM